VLIRNLDIKNYVAICYIIILKKLLNYISVGEYWQILKAEAVYCVINLRFIGSVNGGLFSRK
jgi:hypothetical protein